MPAPDLMNEDVVKARNVQQAVDMQGSKAGAASFEATAADLIRSTHTMMYCSLHHHSTYSYQDGYALPSAHVRRAAELNMPALALTEHGNVSSHAKLAKAAAEFGVHPIFGCELYCGKVDEDHTQTKNHLTVLARNQEGYRDLLRVVSQGWSDFYYEPTVSGEALAKYKSGLVVLSGCTGSLLSTSLVGGKGIAVEEANYERARDVARRFKRVFGDSYFLEVQMFPELENVRIINQAWERLSKELNIPLVATGDCHYTRPSESEMQIILHSIGRHKTMEELARNWGYDVPLSPFDDDAVLDRLVGTGLSESAAISAMRNTLHIAQACDVTIPVMDPVKFPSARPTKEVWLDWLREGWKYRRMNKQLWKKDSAGRNPVARLKYEMSIIESKDFVDYFLIVSDIVKFAKDKGIPVGPARGSAAASLVCYILRITEVNPMDFNNMMVERFIDYTRQDLPDIDLDFDDERRSEVFDYAEQRFGRDKVGKIGTFTYYKSKNSLDDVAYVHHIPKGQVEIVKELLLERSSGDLRASATIEDTAEKFEAAKEVFERYPDLRKAMDLEGNIKTMSTHAAGLVVATRPITDVCAVYTKPDHKGGIQRDDNGMPMQVVSFDKYDAEEHGLLKMDVLGLKNMGMIRIMYEMAGMTLQDVYDLPLDDKATIEGFRRNDCIGIFQFDGWAMRSVNASLKPDNFDEIAVVNALARPGPLHSNASADYVDIKRGVKKAELSHPLLDPIVKSTHGQIVYQEQILRIVQEIGDFDWTHASYIRKIISKKIGEQEFNRQKQAFVTGARKKDMDDATIDKIWGACITAGAYAFNVPHCVSYGMLGYWTMWFKVHHPQVFYAAALRKLGDDKAKQKAILRDAIKHGIDILPPDLNNSKLSWSTRGDDAVIAGYLQIPKIGGIYANAIMDAKDEEVFSSWADLKSIRGIGDKKVESIQEFCQADDPFQIHELERRINSVRNDIRRGRLGDLPRPTHRTEDIPMDRGKDVEVVWLGEIHHRNLRDLLEVNFGKTGEALDLTTIRNPELLEWVIMYGQDETDQMSITIDRYRYPKYKEMVWSIDLEKDIVLVHGVKKGYQSRRALYVWRMWVIDPD